MKGSFYPGIGYLVEDCASAWISVERAMKRRGKKSTDARGTREAVLLCVEDYNQYMEGLDIADQLPSYCDHLISHLMAYAFLGMGHYGYKCLYYF